MTKEYGNINDDKKNKYYPFVFSKSKDKHVSYIDIIPERYKRRDYIIDKINSRKRHIDY